MTCRGARPRTRQGGLTEVTTRAGYSLVASNHRSAAAHTSNHEQPQTGGLHEQSPFGTDRERERRFEYVREETLQAPPHVSSRSDALISIDRVPPQGPKKERKKEMGHPRSQHFVLESRDIEIVTRREGRWGSQRYTLGMAGSSLESTRSRALRALHRLFSAAV